MIECIRCDKKVPEHVYWRHAEMCDKLPLQDKLVKMFDEDRTLCTRHVALLYNVSDKSVISRLDGTHWTRDALRERGRRVQAELISTKPVTLAYHCNRCQILTGNDDGLCTWCKEETYGSRTRWTA